MDYKPIGQRIKNQRLLLRMTREQLAEKLDVSTKFCADIELGNRGMSLGTLCKLSGILHLSCDYILFGSENDNANDEELIAKIAAKTSDLLFPRLAEVIFDTAKSLAKDNTAADDNIKKDNNIK